MWHIASVAFGRLLFCWLWAAMAAAGAAFSWLDVSHPIAMMPALVAAAFFMLGVMMAGSYATSERQWRRQRESDPDSLLRLPEQE